MSAAFEQSAFAEDILVITGLTKRFGGLTAVRDVTTTFEKNRINAIIGPNGAGKTTFFNLVSGYHKPTSGRIIFDGQDVTGPNVYLHGTLTRVLERTVVTLGLARGASVQVTAGKKP